jgi:hypothetical protein
MEPSRRTPNQGTRSQCRRARPGSQTKSGLDGLEGRMQVSASKGARFGNRGSGIHPATGHQAYGHSVPAGVATLPLYERLRIGRRSRNGDE